MAKVQLTKWNADKIADRPRKILESFGPRVAFQAEQEIAKDQYFWPSYTRRKSGELVKPGNRDIVDTGQLMNSATTPNVSGGGSVVTLSIAWTAPYAGQVLTGGYLVGTARNAYIAPPRNWIAKTYRQLQPGGERPLLPFFVAQWKGMAGGG